MSNVEQDIKKQVNVKKVVKAVKDIGHFALYSPDKENNLLFTGQFILNLTEEQAWEVQCGLLVKSRGIWLYTGKEGLQEDKPVGDELILYSRAVKNPNLEIIGHTDLYLENTALYIAPGKYVGIKRQYLEMLGDLPELRQATGNHLVVAAGVHVLTPVKAIKSDYLNLGVF